jgi:hypothetical protein
MNIRLPLALFFMLLATKAAAPDIKSLAIAESIPIDMLNFYETLMRAVVHVESSGDTLAYNAFEDAYGPFQIRPIRLKDYNRRTGKKYTMKDCFTLKVSREIFLYYARHIGSDYETIAKKWNGSGKKTIEYWAKVKVQLKAQENRSPGVKMPS